VATHEKLEPVQSPVPLDGFELAFELKGLLLLLLFLIDKIITTVKYLAVENRKKGLWREEKVILYLS